MDLSLYSAVVGLVSGGLGLGATLLVWRPRAAKDRQRRRWVTAVCLCVVGGFLLWLFYLLGARRTEAPPLDIEREVVVGRVMEASDLEMEAFRHPEAFDLQRLHGVFLPNEQGGEILNQIKERVKFLRARRWHYGEGTRLVARSFPEVAVNGTTAFVRGVESWRLVLRDSRDNRVINRRDLTNTAQLYQLVKVGGRWYVKWSSTPYKESAPD